MQEIFEELLHHKNIKINKITSPKIFTSDEFIQEEDEFVILLDGSATIQIGDEIKDIKKGDYLFIKSNVKHKVLRTSKDTETIWLAIHIF